jgi:hypothetical protein
MLGDNARARPTKVFRPRITARVKELNNRAGDRINPGKIRSLVNVAANAG